MIYEIDKYTDFLCRANITPNQFYICWLIYTKDYANIRKYIKENRKFESDEIKDLIEKGYILNSNPKATHFDIINLHVTLGFAEQIIVEDEEAFDELFEVYPDHVLANNVKYSAKGLKFEEEKGLREAYAKIIKKNKYLHLEIIAITRKWKEDNDNFATMKIDKFITSKYWNVLKEDKGNESGNQLRIV